jgi:hypothetical protein
MALAGTIYLADQYQTVNPDESKRTMDANHWGNVFAFWRTPGSMTPALWPDWDFWGWGYAWIAPLDNVAKQYEAEMPIWDHRDRRVFWTGEGRDCEI